MSCACAGRWSRTDAGRPWFERYGIIFLLAASMRPLRPSSFQFVLRQGDAGRRGLRCRQFFGMTPMATMQKLRSYRGPALLSHGFRPFFLFGAIYAGAMVPLWLTVFAGHLSLPIALAARDWHV